MLTRNELERMRELAEASAELVLLEFDRVKHYGTELSATTGHGNRIRIWGVNDSDDPYEPGSDAVASEREMERSEGDPDYSGGHYESRADYNTALFLAKARSFVLMLVVELEKEQP